MSVAKRKRKKKPYQAEVYVSGVRVASECFETKTEALVWHDKTKKSFEQGYGAVRELTLAEIIDRYEDRVLVSKRVSTRARRKKRFKLLRESCVAEVMMRDFDGFTVDKFLAWLGRHPTAKTATRKSFAEDVKALRLVLGFYRDYYDAQFVVPVTRRHLQESLYKGPVAKKSKDFYLPVDHALRWFAELEKMSNPVYAELAKLQVMTGLRIGEACALCDDAIDWERKLLTVRRTMEWVNEDGSKARRIENRTKTEESRRELPMPAEVQDIVRRALGRSTLLHRDPDTKAMVRVLFHARGGHPLNDEPVRQAYGDAFKAAGLPWSGTHICRDTAGTLGLKGSSLEAVRINHGHSSVVETEGYAKVHAMTQNTVPESIARQLFRGEKSLHVPARVHGQDEAEKANQSS